MLTEIRGRVRTGLCALALVPALLLTLPACADKEAAIDQSHRAELTQALESAEREKSARLLAESRLGSAHRLAVLAGAVGLLLGLAIGGSSRKHSGGVSPDPSPSTLPRSDRSGPDGEPTA